MLRFSTSVASLALVGVVIAACGDVPTAASPDVVAGDASPPDACPRGPLGEDPGAGPSDFPLRLGAWTDGGDGFDAFSDGQELTIVHGSQGGIHVLAAVEIELARAWTEDRVAVDIHGEILVDGAVEASTELDHFWLGAVDTAVFRSATLLLVFEIWDAPRWDDREALLEMSVTTVDTGEVAAARCRVVLVDEGE